MADGVGSVRTELVSDTVEAVTTYSPYGNLLAQTGASGTVHGFTGEQYDRAADLLFLRARYYSPYLKVFLSIDPFIGSMRRPSTQHGYIYVGNNPINKVDPTGAVEQWWEDMLEDLAWRQVILDSAFRHNRAELTGLDNNGFAAVLASVILIESKDIGGSNPNPIKRFVGDIINPLNEDLRIPLIMGIKQLEILTNSIFGGSQSEGICNIDPAIWNQLEAYPEIVVHVYGASNSSPLAVYENRCPFPGTNCSSAYPWDYPVGERYVGLHPDPAGIAITQWLVDQVRQDNNVELLAAKFELVTLRLRDAGIDGSQPDSLPLRNPSDAELTIAVRAFAQFHARGIIEPLGNVGNWYSEEQLRGIELAGDVAFSDRQRENQSSATAYYHLIRQNWWSAYTHLSRPSSSHTAGHRGR